MNANPRTPRDTRAAATWLAGAVILVVSALAVATQWEPLRRGTWDASGRAWLVLVTVQVLSLWVARASGAPRLGPLPALAVGLAGGTGAAVALTRVVDGRVPWPPLVLLTDVLLLVSLLLAWDAILRRAQRQTADDGGAGDLVDARHFYYGPSGSLRLTLLYRYRDLLRQLVAKDLKLKYRGSVLGFLWSLLNPLISIAVYAFAFGYILRVQTPAFALFLLLGVLPWTFFAASLSMSTGAIADNAGLMKSTRFPRAVLPMAAVFFNLAQHALSISVLVPVMFLVYSRQPGLEVFAYPVFLGLQVVLTVGLALLVSTATAFLPDIRHLLDVALGVLFWLTPIVYTFASLPERAQQLLLLNPMSTFVVTYQRIFYDQVAPEPGLYVLATALAAASLAVGYTAFSEAERHLMDRL